MSAGSRGRSTGSPWSCSTGSSKGKTLVVWAFDASRSLLVEREKLAKHIEQVYVHINQLDKDQVAVGDALMTMVVGFGETRKAMLAAPTSDTAAIASAIREVPDDTTGIETTFQTVGSIVKNWGKYKDAKGQTYQTIVIVVTDEVGDDDQFLESAITTASAAKVPVYVLGSPAVFGKRDVKMNFTDPKTKKTHYNLNVRQGPESVAARDDPPALLVHRRPVRQPRRRLRPLRPQPPGRRHRWHLLHHPDGQQSAQLRPQRDARIPPRLDQRRPVQQEPPEGPSPGGRRRGRPDHPAEPPRPARPVLSRRPTPPSSRRRWSATRTTIARIEYTVNEALVPITQVSKLRDRETSRRWQAHYDLIRGRLLAMKIRCAEYQTACARMKKDAPKFQDAKSNAWRLVPTEEILSGDKVAKVAKDTKALLQRVVDDHPNTPWALLAKRELKDPFGFKWAETYVKPPPPRKEVDAAEAKKKKEMKKEMPKEPEIKL